MDRKRAPKKGRSVATRARIAEAQDRALAMKRAGATYAQIGKEMGVCTMTAHNYVSTALAAIPRENAEAVLLIELERLDRDWRRVEKKLDALENANGGGAIHATCELLGQARRIQDRRARYLGLDAPEKVENSGSVVVVTLEDLDATRATIEHNLA